MTKQFKMLNNQVGDIVEKIAKKAPSAPDMKNTELQELNEAITNTIGLIKTELKIVEKALSGVIDVVVGEISRRGISEKVDKQISIFDDLKTIESK